MASCALAVLAMFELKLERPNMRCWFLRQRSLRSNRCIRLLLLSVRRTKQCLVRSRWESESGRIGIITEGPKPGEKIIVQGFTKVREGTPISPKPYVVASAAEGN